MRLNDALFGAGLGAGLMFFMDPSRGARRRALLRDQLVHGLHKTADAAGATARDVRNRVTGVAAKAGRLVQSDRVSDRVLEERVRARLGRYASHPGAIHVAARNGVVTLEGDVLAHEHAGVASTAAATRGVTELQDRLDAHNAAEGVPSLQGGVPRQGESLGIFQAGWSPATRLSVGTAGAAALLVGAGRRDGLGMGLAILGSALLVRSLTNLESQRLTGIGAGRRAIDLQKTLDINAPVDLVFDQWADVERFPTFLSHVLEVRRSNVDGQTHWKVTGPLGPIEFDAVVTGYIPGELIAWRTVEGSVVQHAGIVRFEPNGDDATRVHIRMSCNPPEGAIGNATAWLLQRDLRSQIEDDLRRLQSFLETGEPAHDAANPVR